MRFRCALKPRVRRGVIIAAVGCVAGGLAGSAIAVPPERFVTFDLTSDYQDARCGDAIIHEEDVGRITFTRFFNPDGSEKALVIHFTAVTQTLTNTETGITLTNFYSQVFHERVSVDPETGVIAVEDDITGLNFIIRSADGGPPLVSAGRGVDTYNVTFDGEGNVIVSDVSRTSTPNLVHLLQVLCA